MSVAAVQLMTAEEFEALPDDGIERDLIRGELRERTTMTRRNRSHARIECRVAHLLNLWLDGCPDLALEAYSGEVGCVLRREPDTTVGVDVVVASYELERTAEDAGTTLLAGAPVLAVEILSPYDIQKDIDEKIALYLECGVALVWVINPKFETVDVYRPDAAPERFNVD
jgi:Uma2 family endonuclease